MSAATPTRKTGTVARPPSETLKSPKALKSYLARITDAPREDAMTAFAAFPVDVGFDGQDRGEHIVLLLRQHLAVFIPRIFVVIGMMLVPVIFVPLLAATDTNITLSDVSFGLGVAVLWIMLIISYVMVTFFKWFFSVNIVTTERIIDIDFNRLVYHRVSEAQLEKIEDVSHSAVGMWPAVFDFGDVYIQTAAEQREFEFENVPRPRDVQDTINDLLELKQS